MARQAAGQPQDRIDALLKDDVKFYKKAWEKMRIVEKINKDRAVAHQLLLEKLKKLQPNASCEALMSLAYQLEDRGLLAEAADVYQQVLTRPDFQQLDNRELRAHLAQLIAKVNRQQLGQKALERQAEFEAEGRLQPGRPRGLQPQQPRVPGVPRGSKPVGHVMPMSPDAYRAELAAQAMEVRRRRAAAQREEQLRDLKQLAVAAAMDALAQHQQHVVGGNDKLSYAEEQRQARQDREEERRRQFYMEWDQLKAAAEVAKGGPLDGLDELQRRRAQIQAAHAHRGLARNAYEGSPDPRALYHDAYGHDPAVLQEELAAARDGRPYGNGGGAHQDLYYYQPGAAVAAGLPRRPASAGAVAAARDKERERNNAANFGRLYVPGHPYAPAAGPPPMAAWPAPPATAGDGRRGGGGGGGAAKGAAVKAPFGRPDVDRPRVPIDLKVVRARQQAFLDKRRKPAEAPPQQVPLRLRKEAARRPSQPVVAAEGAFVGGR